ncbi:competence protein CoiA [Devosia riboflavina]|uniref:competence protein CoiA n=1 Tax=Devosia riboflavina TaxID=46914 RepID=UPI000689E334|nr:competence protein CoiA family protein [Devosia riboflavina]
MHIALVNGVRTPPSPGLRGHCPVCENETIAKCGEQRIWHWAHRGKLHCDPWWERETTWHRHWKNLFPEAWQEQLSRDPSGQKHIADVRTPFGTVLEFQYSAIAPEERRIREGFYGNLLWIVSGARLKTDFPRFEAALKRFTPSPYKDVSILRFPEEYFRKAWLDSSVPVIFDFRGVDAILPASKTKELIWCLLPRQFQRHVAVAAITRSYFVEAITSGHSLMDHLEILERCEALVRKQRQRDEADWNARFIASVRGKRGYYGRG